MFDNVKFRKGLQLNFTSGRDGALITRVDNKQVNSRDLFLVVKRITSRHPGIWLNFKAVLVQ